MYLDYHVLIDKVESETDSLILQQLHENSIHPDFSIHQVVLLKNIKHLLKGVGRIVQYFNPLPSHSIDFQFHDHNFLWSVFEGQISEGIADGFARILYADSGRSYSGYYKQGHKMGKGIQLKKDGSVQSEGLWEGNQTLARAQVIESFDENELCPKLESENTHVYQDTDEEDI